MAILCWDILYSDTSEGGTALESARFIARNEQWQLFGTLWQSDFFLLTDPIYGESLKLLGEACRNSTEKPPNSISCST
jgi:hypothetical protein